MSRLLKLMTGAAICHLVGLVLFSVLSGAFPAWLLQITKSIFDSASADLKTSRVLGLVGLLTLLTIAQSGVANLASFCSSVIASRVRPAASSELLMGLCGVTDIALFESPKFQDDLQRGFDAAENDIPSAVFALEELLGGIIAIACVATVLTQLGGSILTLTITGACLSSLLAVKTTASISRMNKRVSRDRRRAGYLRFVLMSPQFQRELKVSGGDRMISNGLVEAQRRIGAAEHEKSSRVHFYRSLSTVFPALATGFLLSRVALGGNSVGSLALAIGSFQALSGAMTRVISGASGLRLGNSYCAELTSFWRGPVSSTDLAVETTAGYSSGNSRPGAVNSGETPTNTTLGPSIRLEDVDFNYNEIPIFSKLSLKIEAGSAVAVMGKNGAGKTTLLKLLQGVSKPAAGNIFINELPLDQSSVAAHWCRIGVMAQDPVRLEDTLRTNIDLGKSASGHRVSEAATKAGLSALVGRLPDGLDTKVSLAFGEGEAGIELSGGEWQRVALARLLLSRDPITFLDEPTSRLDSVSESEIVNILAHHLKGSTRVIITHDAQILSIVDRVIVLEGGQVVADGSPKDLIFENDLFRSLISEFNEKNESE